MGKKSRVISFRLYEDDPTERHVLSILDDLQRQGFTPRQIVADAILARDGLTPEMFRRRFDAPAPSIDADALRDALAQTTESLLRDFLADIKRAVRSGAIRIDDAQEDTGGALSPTESALIMSHKMRTGGKR